MELHIDYEQQPEYPLEQVEDPKADITYRVEKMKLSKDKTELRYNGFLTLRGIPPGVYDYRLGNRSALEWVIDQYQVTTDKRSGIINDPNREDDPKYILPPHRPGHHRLPGNQQHHRRPSHPCFTRAGDGEHADGAERCPDTAPIAAHDPACGPGDGMTQHLGGGDRVGDGMADALSRLDGMGNHVAQRLQRAVKQPSLQTRGQLIRDELLN